MRGNKAYSNVGFTRRVDRAAGAHRGPKAHKEPLVCGACGNVYVKRRWILATDPRAWLLARTADAVTCPACQAATVGSPRGFLRLEGAFFVAHRPDIVRLLMREAERAAEDNPLARIISWDNREADVLTVSTTTEHLVERLGHAVVNAYGGDIDYGFSHENKFARGKWRRAE